MRFTRETWSSFWPEAEPLVLAHRAETGSSDPRPFEPQLALVSQMMTQGWLQIIGARDEQGLLVGYVMWYLSPQIDSIGLMANQGPWFMAQAHRRGTAGFKLFKHSLDVLQGLGIRWASPHHWMEGEGPKLEAFFLGLGARPLEHSFLLSLQKGSL